jgi:hypothetical protein
MPPMPPMPPPPGIGGAGSFGNSATMASVVTIRAATEQSVLKRSEGLCQDGLERSSLVARGCKAILLLVAVAVSRLARGASDGRST